MTQRSRWAFPRFARVVAAWVAAVVLGAGALAAQGTSGKIEGTVRDQSGAPLNGAQVFIVGTAFAAVSNERGYYFLNNVPAGSYTVRGQYIGYSPGEVRQVRVFAGQTMTINIPLEQRAIEVSGVTVTVEQTPIVPRDQVTSKGIMQGDVISALPFDAVGQMLRLQPGAVGHGGQRDDLQAAFPRAQCQLDHVGRLARDGTHKEDVSALQLPASQHMLNIGIRQVR